MRNEKRSRNPFLHFATNKTSQVATVGEERRGEVYYSPLSPIMSSFICISNALSLAAIFFAFVVLCLQLLSVYDSEEKKKINCSKNSFDRLTSSSDCVNISGTTVCYTRTSPLVCTIVCAIDHYNSLTLSLCLSLVIVLRNHV